MIEKIPTPPEGKEYVWEDWRDGGWPTCPDCGEVIEEDGEFNWDGWLGFCKCQNTCWKIKVKVVEVSRRED